ncbi:hypothetical protein C1645_734267 [Glomus cerebriforme]|uniref:Uncharacterized protein n=1 Tax=Glomus cerebriforme TaxID=658196 RepID=A0A397TF62_9GLOM|nr:hypothetical protein C1645_734267 [Glomus cerebriforme]
MKQKKRNHVKSDDKYSDSNKRKEKSCVKSHSNTKRINMKWKKRICESSNDNRRSMKWKERSQTESDNKIRNNVEFTKRKRYDKLEDMDKNLKEALHQDVFWNVSRMLQETQMDKDKEERK